MEINTIVQKSTIVRKLNSINNRYSGVQANSECKRSVRMY